jgi:hypothetical protein
MLWWIVLKIHKSNAVGWISVVENPKPSKWIQGVVLYEEVEAINNIPSDGLRQSLFCCATTVLLHGAVSAAGGLHTQPRDRLRRD